MDSVIRVSGAQALAKGAIEAGASLVTSYAGGPVTAVVNAIRDQTSPDQVHVEWTSNEKVAIELAFGGSMGGARSLLCVKSVGLNIAMDPLMTFNLCGSNAGLVLLVGDDPGAWGSQNEQDSRALALAAELPLIEPTSVSDARRAILEAFALSEEMGLPTFVRITRALALAEAEVTASSPLPDLSNGTPPPFQREFMRWVVLPINAVEYHERLLRRLDAVRDRFEQSPLNELRGNGSLGVIAVGATSLKLLDLLGDEVPTPLAVLRLGTVHPTPLQLVTSWLRNVKAVLVLEETALVVERAIQAAAYRAGLTLPIYGRDTGHVPPVGELFGPHLATVLNELEPDLALPTIGQTTRPLPSRVPLCERCPYTPTFDALLEVLEELGGREEAIVVGDPGCIARSQLPPYELLDVKISLGSSIGIASGIAWAQAHPNRSVLKSERTESASVGKHVVAISGDSSFLHSGLNGLMDASRLGVPLLVLVLDNGVTALTGGQPHPATPADARGNPRPAVELASLSRQAGATHVALVDLDGGQDIRPAIKAGMIGDGVSVVIARGECPRYAIG